MGNWHCIPSSCATVHYREYQGDKIRWRYGSEPWQEINGDDYSTIEFTPPCPNQPHELNYGRQNVTGNFSDCSATDITVFAPVRGWTGNRNAPFSNLRISVPSQNFEIIYPNPLTAPQLTKHWCANSNFRIYFYVTDNTGTERLLVNTGARGFHFISFQVEPNSAQNCPANQCTFNITKNGEIIHTETRSTCPEVEKIPCSLSDVNKQIKIKKTRFLSYIEVIPYGRSSIQSPRVPYPLPTVFAIPNECLNIYKNDFLNPLPDQLDGSNDPVFGDYIAQICSAPGCPPPEYEVICDCNNCESCPDGTCPVECDGQICCYNDYGISIKEIALNNYCGGGQS